MSITGNILALDLATHTGVCDGVPGAQPALSTHSWREDKAEDVQELYGRATGWMARRLKDDPPSLIVIENVVPPSAAWGSTNHNTTMLTIGLFGIFCGIARVKNIELMLAPISTWRKYALGKGNLKTKDAKARALALCSQLHWTAPDHNAAEAACIWLWACANVAPAIARRPEPLFARAS